MLWFCSNYVASVWICRVRLEIGRCVRPLQPTDLYCKLPFSKQPFQLVCEQSWIQHIFRGHCTLDSELWFTSLALSRCRHRVCDTNKSSSGGESQWHTRVPEWLSYGDPTIKMQRWRNRPCSKEAELKIKMLPRPWTPLDGSRSRRTSEVMNGSKQTSHGIGRQGLGVNGHVDIDKACIIRNRFSGFSKLDWGSLKDIFLITVLRLSISK